MGVIKRGILGGFSGKVANVIGGSWKGIAYMRSMPLSVANPNTAGQVTQRGYFSKAVASAKEILGGFVRPLWNRFVSGESGFNGYVKAYVSMLRDGGVFDKEKYQLSAGGGVYVGPCDGEYDSATQSVAVSWDAAPDGANALPTDRAYIVIRKTNGDLVGAASASFAREAGGGNVPVSEVLGLTNNAHVFLVFRRLDGTQVSNTRWGEIIYET
jgi:hypothetical protein